jgi:sulfopropanediol 3-dehydrogenase
VTLPSYAHRPPDSHEIQPSIPYDALDAGSQDQLAEGDQTMGEYLKKAQPPAQGDFRAVQETVAQIVEDVRLRGLEAVRECSRKFDRWDPPSFKVGHTEVEAARASIAPEVLASLDFANEQIGSFARLQRESMTDFEVETRPGVFLGQKHIPVMNSGAYVPGGKYPMLMSAQMTILTAKVAGVQRVVGCAPPYESAGIYPEMLWSMALAGADEIWCVGGVQALALMAYGADGYEPVEFIAGPGNMYVAEAKRQLFGKVGIDLLAGPTEILVIADEASDPRIVAADLLGQAEHGPTSPAVLVSLSRDTALAVLTEIDRQLAGLSTRAAPHQHAPEHLEVQTADPDWYLGALRNYGTLCLGEEATIVFSDKAIGTNHTLPTGGAARYTGGLWVGKFLKTVTYQRCTRAGAVEIARHAALLSEVEHFEGHARTAHYRAEKYTE